MITIRNLRTKISAPLHGRCVTMLLKVEGGVQCASVGESPRVMVLKQVKQRRGFTVLSQILPQRDFFFSLER